MRYLVFAQRPTASLDLAGVVGNARRYFEAEVGVDDAVSDDDGATMQRARLALTSARHGYGGRFELSARAAREHDWTRADAAELAGRAAGMAALARRCACVWDVEALEPADLRATLNLCALLASVGLGPVLPPDGSTLLGVRSAMLQLEKLLRQD